MSSNNSFTTYNTEKQAEIIQKLMVLFKGNERFHGAANVTGSIRDEDKNKWEPAHPHYEFTTATEIEWRAHLSGQRFLGLSPILDDGTVWFTCLDVDKSSSGNYDFEYSEEMDKITQSGFPLVVYRTKSGGLRVTIFFSEPVPAELAQKRIQQIAAQLGYGGCEIFPKQIKVGKKDGKLEYPNWIYLPYGPTGDEQFAEQCCMNESGNPMALDESIVFAMQKRITKQQFADLFVVEMKARANGKANGKKYPAGVWPEPPMEESYTATIERVFCDGPMCLWIIARDHCSNYQHNFLLNVASFFMWKYSDNWDIALTWVNYNVLRPAGDKTKLDEMIKSLKHKGKRYDYTCSDEPICSHCYAKACRSQKFGVGASNGVNFRDLAITIVDTRPQIFFVGEERIVCSANELLSVKIFRAKCLEVSSSFPDMFTQKEWDHILKSNLENAIRVNPPEVFKTDAKELRIMEEWLSVHINTGVRAWGQEFMDGKQGEYVRMREDEKRIYFKHKRLLTAVRLQRGTVEEKIMTEFIGNKCMEHKQGPGVRDWFRYSHSIGFDQFDDEMLQKWLNPDKEDKDG
jgi:hypothetical protein